MHKNCINRKLKVKGMFFANFQLYPHTMSGETIKTAFLITDAHFHHRRFVNVCLSDLIFLCSKFKIILCVWRMNDRHFHDIFRFSTSGHYVRTMLTICCQLYVIGSPTRSARRVTMSEHAHNLLSIECHRVTDQIWRGT